MNHRNYFLVVILFFTQVTLAETLKYLAMKSTALLVLSDEPELQTKCQLSPEKISDLSQKLKIAVDARIEKLTDPDFAILNSRTEGCQRDCSCTIYTLAFEMRNKKNEILSAKASKETHAQRIKCVSKLKNICLFVKKI